MFQQLIENTHINWDVLWYIILAPFILFWVWSILFVTKDISHRTDSLFYQVFSILLVFFLTPIIWLPIYFLIRPIRLQDDIEWRKSIACLSITCLECDMINHKDNDFCVWCWENLKLVCKECAKKYYNGYDYCPHCWAPNIDIES